MSKTVSFQVIPFSMSTQFSSIGPLSGAITPGQSGPGSDGNEDPALLEPHYQIVYCHHQDTHWEVLPLCRGAVSVFYSSSQLGSIAAFCSGDINAFLSVGELSILNLELFK